MSLTTNAQIEIVAFGQQGWGEGTIEENAIKLDAILEKFPPLWDLVSQTEKDILAWNGTSEEWEARAGFLSTPLALTDQAEIATDASGKDTFTVTLEGNRTLKNPTNILPSVSIKS